MSVYWFLWLSQLGVGLTLCFEGLLPSELISDPLASPEGWQKPLPGEGWDGETSQPFSLLGYDSLLLEMRGLAKILSSHPLPRRPFQCELIPHKKELNSLSFHQKKGKTRATKHLNIPW